MKDKIIKKETGNMTQQLKKRSEVSENLTWDLSSIFKSEAEFEKT